MRNWTVQVNLDGGFAHHSITFVFTASRSAVAIALANDSMRLMGFKGSDYQAHII